MHTSDILLKVAFTRRNNETKIAASTDCEYSTVNFWIIAPYFCADKSL